MSKRERDMPTCLMTKPPRLWPMNIIGRCRSCDDLSTEIRTNLRAYTYILGFTFAIQTVEKRSHIMLNRRGGRSVGESRFVAKSEKPHSVALGVQVVWQKVP